MTALQLPPTIRPARLDESPNNATIRARMAQRQTAKIVEGFTVQQNEGGELPFQFYSKINVDNNRLWSLIKSLLFTFPDEVSFLFGFVDNEPTMTSYSDKFGLLNKLDLVETELTQDGYLEFGFLFHDDEMLQELFVKRAKYIQFWGVDIASFRKVMTEYALYEISDLNFIDEYPMVTEALRRHNASVKDTPDLLDYFESMN